MDLQGNSVNISTVKLEARGHFETRELGIRTQPTIASPPAPKPMFRTAAAFDFLSTLRRLQTVWYNVTE
jgi:hypothetical protein